MSQNKSFLKSLQVGIVGGGPGGLALARLLQMRGVQVTVFEQEPARDSRPQGSSLDLKAESGRKVVKAAGLDEEFLRFARFEGDRHLVMDHDGKVYVNLPEVQFLASAPEIDRPELKELFLSSLTSSTVKWNYKLHSLEAGEDAVVLHFDNAETFSFDFVVGADGAGSRVRPYVTDVKREYSGISWIEGEIKNPNHSVPELYRLVDHGNAFALGEEKGFLLQEKGDGVITFYLTAKIPQVEIATLTEKMKNPQAAEAYFTRWFTNWHPMFMRAVRASTQKYIIRPINGTPIDQSWVPQKRLTLLGDAAHLMPPFAGEGANSAMLDALMLTQALEETTGTAASEKLANAIRIYEVEMLARTAQAKRQTEANEQIFHEPDAAENLTKEILGRARIFAPFLPTMIRSLNFITAPFLRGRRIHRA